MAVAAIAGVVMNVGIGAAAITHHPPHRPPQPHQPHGHRTTTTKSTAPPQTTPTTAGPTTTITAPIPLILSFTGPSAVSACPSNITLSWTTSDDSSMPYSTQSVELFRDGTSLGTAFPLSGRAGVGFPCGSRHTYMLEAFGSMGTTATQSLVVGIIVS